MIFFIITIILIPCYFIQKIQESQRDVGGVDVENRRAFAESINENMLGKHIPAFISKTSEMRALKVRSKEEFDALNRVKQTDEAKEIIPKPPKGPDGKPIPGAVHVKSISLIVGYMYDLFDEKEK